MGWTFHEGESRRTRFEIWIFSEYISSIRYGRVRFNWLLRNLTHQGSPCPSMVPLFPIKISETNKVTMTIMMTLSGSVCCLTGDDDVGEVGAED